MLIKILHIIGKAQNVEESNGQTGD